MKTHREKIEAIQEAIRTIRQNLRTDESVHVAKDGDRHSRQVEMIREIRSKLMNIENNITQGVYGEPSLVAYEIMRAVEGTGYARHVVADVIIILA